MLIRNRFFDAGTTYKLCVFSIQEGGDWAPPEGTEIVHVEPIVNDAVVDGMYLWALVPDSQMHEVVGEHDDHEG